MFAGVYGCTYVCVNGRVGAHVTVCLNLSAYARGCMHVCVRVCVCEICRECNAGVSTDEDGVSFCSQARMNFTKDVLLSVTIAH